MYSEKLLQYFQSSRWVGTLPAPAVKVEVMNPICGDILQLSLEFNGNSVSNAAFRAKGCTASIAAGAALAEWSVGKSLSEIGQLTAASVESLLDGLPNESKHAAVLAVDAARAVSAARISSSDTSSYRG